MSRIIDGLVVSGLMVATYLYLRAWRRGSAAGGGPIWMGQLGWFLSGASLIMAALVGPVHRWAEQSLSGHMAQHILLLAAPLPLVLARTATGLILGLDPSLRGRVLRMLDGTWGRFILSGAPRPVVAWPLLVGVVGVWHIPVLYDAVLDSEALHGLEHLSLVAVGWIYWSSLVPMGRPRPRRHGPAMASIFATMLVGTAFGALLTFATVPWYPAHAGRVIGSGGNWLQDQQLAGLIMWIPPGMVLLGMFLWLGATWLKALEGDRPSVTGGTVRSMVVVAASLAAVLALASPAAAQDEEERAYLATCAGCHGVHGEGTPWAPSITEQGAAGAHLMMRTGRMPLRTPEEPIRRGEQRLTDQQIQLIVSYVERFGGPSIPEVDPGAGDLAVGGRLYLLECAACHGAAGVGGALVGARNAPPIIESTALDIAEAIRSGPGPMPAYDEATLSPHEVDSIVLYVLNITAYEARGGWRLGRWGPVAEGAAAWLIGVVAVLAAAYWIEGRTGHHRPEGSGEE